MAYILGFYAADGYITKNKRGAYFFCLEINDGHLIRKIRKVLGSNHKISRRAGDVRRKNSFRLQIGSKELCNDVLSLGFAIKKTHKLLLPNIPSHLFLHFVRGYFDGDGNVWVGKVHKDRKTSHLAIQTVFTSCSKAFLEDLREALLKYGIKGGLYCQSTYYRLYYSIHSSIKLYELMYSDLDSTLFLPRKKNVYKRFLKKRNKLRP